MKWSMVANLLNRSHYVVTILPTSTTLLVSPTMTPGLGAYRYGKTGSSGTAASGAATGSG